VIFDQLQERVSNEQLRSNERWQEIETRYESIASAIIDWDGADEHKAAIIFEQVTLIHLL
jgi:hypothetical protein